MFIDKVPFRDELIWRRLLISDRNVLFKNRPLVVTCRAAAAADALNEYE